MMDSLFGKSKVYALVGMVLIALQVLDMFFS
jgi:hypothetical protein